MDTEIRTIEPQEFDAYVRMLEGAFSGGLEPDEIDNHRRVTEFARCLVAVDGESFVGAAAANSFRITIPGDAAVAAAGVTGVGVLPTHRRRGINTALMRRQLDDVHERGEPLAALFASEGGIYGRYGYGSATSMCSIDVEADRSGYVRGYRPEGRVRLLDREAALTAMLPVYRQAQRLRPGMIEMDATWLDWRFFEPERKKKEDPVFYAVHESETGDVDGYVVYSVKHDWKDAVPRNTLTIEELVATSPSAYADTWRYVLDVDLVERVKAWGRPPDEPLVHLLREPRRLRLTLGDGMWLRLVDLPAALAARAYASEDRLVLEVEDTFCPWNDGTFELVSGSWDISCETTTATSELRCSVNDLAAIYLGGATFRQLAEAGRVREERSGALDRADRMFASAPAPWCSFVF